MSDYSVNVPAEDYKGLVRKAIAFDMVCDTVKHLKPYQWEDVLKPLCSSIAPERFAAAVGRAEPDNPELQSAE